MALHDSVGGRHTEYGGGVGWPERKPDGTGAKMDPQSSRRAMTAAGWDEVRGDVGAGVGLPVRVGVERAALNPSQTANGYASDAALPGYSSAIAGRAGS